MAIALHKYTQDSWERVRDYVKADLERLEMAFNRLPAPQTYTIHDYIPSVVSAGDFGPLGSGVAIQAAIDSLDDVLGGTVLIPPNPNGLWIIGAPIMIRKPNVTLRGQNMGSVTLHSQNPTTHVIDVHASNITIADLTISSPTNVKTAGAGIYVGEDPDNPGNYTDYFRLFNCLIMSQWVNVQLYTCRNYWIRDCIFQQARSTQVLISNSIDPDQQDASISGCNFSGVADTVIHLTLTASGLRLYDNKFLGGDAALNFTLPTGGTTNLSDLIISGNSFEAQLGRHIQISQQSGTSAWAVNIQILGNQFGATEAITVVPNSGDTVYIYALTIVGNNIVTTSTKNGIVLSGVSGGYIGSNYIETTAGGTNYGILIASSCGQIEIGPNSIYNFPAARTISNADTTTNIQPRAMTNYIAWDPGSIAAGASLGTFVTVSGARAGDPAIASFTLLDGSAAWGLSAYVLSTHDSVEVVLTNTTAGAIDLGAGYVRATVFHYFHNTIGN